MQEAVIRVGVDLTPTLPDAENGGIKFATFEFIDGLLSYFSSKFTVTLFCSEIALDEIEGRFAGRAEVICTKFGRDRTHAMGDAIEELRSRQRIATFCRRHQIDVMYSPLGRFLTLPLRVPLVVQVPDLIQLDYPGTLSKSDRIWRHFNLKKLSVCGAIFQVPSDFTRQRLHTSYAVPLQRIYRTYQTIHGRLARCTPRNGEHYFLYPARPWPHKNHKNLFRAYRLYRERLGQNAWNLALTAGRGDRIQKLQAFAAETGVDNYVKFLGEISDQELAQTYSDASALVFPSRYEGFGIPLLEAMYFRLPVICGRGGSQTEIAGSAAFYVNVEDPGELAHAMERLTVDAGLREELVEKGDKELKRFSWKDEVRKLADILESAASERSTPTAMQEFRERSKIMVLECESVICRIANLGAA